MRKFSCFRHSRFPFPRRKNGLNNWKHFSEVAFICSTLSLPDSVRVGRMALAGSLPIHIVDTSVSLSCTFRPQHTQPCSPCLPIDTQGRARTWLLNRRTAIFQTLAKTLVLAWNEEAIGCTCWVPRAVFNALISARVVARSRFACDKRSRNFLASSCSSCK